MILVIFFKLLFSSPACPEIKVNEANEGISAIQEKQQVIWKLSSWCYSLIWNDTCSHVLSPVFTVLEAKCGILRPESTTFSQDISSDSYVEDVVETFPQPSPWFEGICHPVFPSPEPVSKLLKSVAGLGHTKVSCSVCNSSFPVFVHIPVPWSLWWQKGSQHRNRSPQSHDMKWCDNKSHTCAWFRFINIGIWSMLLWKKRITKHWGVNSGSWWWTGRPGVLQFMGSQRVGHDWVTELNWTEEKQLDEYEDGGRLKGKNSFKKDKMNIRWNESEDETGIIQTQQK